MWVDVKMCVGGYVDGNVEDVWVVVLRMCGW